MDWVGGGQFGGFLYKNQQILLHSTRLAGQSKIKDRSFSL